MKKQLIIPIVFSVFSFLFANAGHASVTALKDATTAQARGFFDLHTGTYVPVYSQTLTAGAGDTLRLAGQIEGSEKNGRDDDDNAVYAKLWSYIRVTTPDGTEVRVSPYAWQWASRRNNHHMPLYLYGSYNVSVSGEYKVDLMARATSTVKINLSNKNSGVECPALTESLEGHDRYCPLAVSGVAKKNMWVEAIPSPVVENGVITNLSDYDLYDRQYGQLIVEHYKDYTSEASASADGAMGIVDFDRKRIALSPNPCGSPGPCDPPDHLEITQDTIHSAGETKSFSVSEGDIIRTMTQATAQFGSLNNLFAFTLRAFDQDGNNRGRLSISTENVVTELFRFSLHNDGLIKARSNDVGLLMRMEVKGIEKEKDGVLNVYTLLDNEREIAAIQFSGHGNPKYLEETYYAPLGTDEDYTKAEFNNEFKEIHTYAGGAASASDILRVQSQVQTDLTSGTHASCQARIEIREEGARKYLSVIDQRFLREGTHVSASFSPFAVHQFANDITSYEVKLLARCNSSAPDFEIFFKNYGQGLIVDRFGL